MSGFVIKKTLEEHFIDNWTDTPIQHDGQTINYDGVDSFISLKYVAVSNTLYYSGKKTTGQLQIFCYAKSTSLAYQLSDTVFNFIKCLDLDNDVHTKTPQVQGSAINLDGEFFEVFTFVPVECYS